MNVSGITGHRKQIRYLESLLAKGNIPNTILFRGPSGIGKSIIAKRFLNSLFCDSDNSPCLSCSICNHIAKDTFSDLIEITPNEKGVIPIGDRDKREAGSIRWLIERLTLKSTFGKTGVIINSVDRVTKEGQNALLKTIEEPHENVYLILVSSSKGKLLPTLISRCFELKFQSLSESETIDVLKSIDISQEIIDPIASISNGSIETAVLLSNEEVLSEVMNLCSNISSFLNNRSVFNIDFTAIRKKVDARHLIDILINIYRYNLLCMIKGEGDVLYFKDIYIKDYQMIFYLLKILLAIKMKEVYNLNIKYAFKGMLYSIYKNDFQDITKKNFFL